MTDQPIDVVALAVECERLAGALAGCGVLAHSRNPDTDCGIYADIASVRYVRDVVADLAKAMRVVEAARVLHRSCAPLHEVPEGWTPLGEALAAMPQQHGQCASCGAKLNLPGERWCPACIPIPRPLPESHPNAVPQQEPKT